MRPRVLNSDKTGRVWMSVLILGIVGGLALPALGWEKPVIDGSTHGRQDVAPVIFNAQRELEEGRPDAALTLIDGALSGDETEAFWRAALLYWQGETFERLSRQSDAIRSYRAVVEKDPSSEFGALAASRLAVLLPEEKAREFARGIGLPGVSQPGQDQPGAEETERRKDKRLEIMFLTKAAVRGDSEALSQLMSLVEEGGTASTRRAAIQSLAWVRDPKVDEFLVRLVPDEEDAGVTRAALYAIAGRSSASSIPVLKQIASSSDEESLRILAIQGLMNQRSPEIAPFLKSIVDGEATPRVKVTALQCLYGRWEIEASELLDILDRREEEPVRVAAAQALSGIDASRGLDSKQLQRIRDLASRESDRAVWKYEIMAISKVGGDSSVHVLSELARETSVTEDRGLLLKAMFNTGSPAVIQTVRDLLANMTLNDAELRTLAHGIATLSDSRAFDLIDEVHRASGDPSSQRAAIQATVALALRLDQCRRGSDLLVRYSTRTKDRDVARSIIEGLMQLKCNEASRAARQLLDERGK